MRSWSVTRFAREHRLNGDVDIAATAALIGDGARAAMLLALAGGQPLSASDLARRASIRPSTASSHLARLTAGGLLAVERQGRERRYRLANSAVADAVEALAAIAPSRPVNSLSERDRWRALRAARTCYDHLAGQLGVALFDALVARGALTGVEPGTPSTRKVRAGLGAVPIGPEAPEVFARLGIDLGALQQSRRQFATACLDWSEEQPHLGGALGAALCATCFANGWCRRHQGERAVVVTESGREAFGELFGLEW